MTIVCTHFLLVIVLPVLIQSDSLNNDSSARLQFAFLE